MSGSTILQILELGGTGLAFLLAFLAYGLLRREQDQPKVRNSMLKSIKHYAYIQLALFVLSAVVNVVTTFITPAPEPRRTKDCEQAVQRAQTMSKLPTTTSAGFQAALDNVVIKCELSTPS